MSLYAKVYVADMVYNIDKAYDYSVPQEFARLVCVGQRILVPFGVGNRKRQGVIIELSDVKSYDKVKPIAIIIDDDPLLSQNELDLIFFMKERYFCTFFEALYTLLPSGINISVKITYEISRQTSPAFTDELQEIYSIFEINNYQLQEYQVAELNAKQKKLIEQLCEQGYITKKYQTRQNVRDANVKIVQLNEALFNDENDGEFDVQKYAKNAKQRAVIEGLLIHKTLAVNEIEYLFDVSPSIVKTLEKNKVVQIFDEEVFRSPISQAIIDGVGDKGLIKPKEITLSVEQKEVYDGLCEQYNNLKPSAALLYGVTASGKTSVYIKLIDYVLSKGKGAIIMFPEIALTTQMTDAFYRRYGTKLAVVTSKLSLGQRYDEYKRIKSGKATVVIGTRSCVFSPMSNLGLIIIDEEQEHTYKSEMSPRYHARDVAKYKCVKSNALLLLGSATPSLESYHKAVTGTYTLYQLHKRYNNVTLPEVQLCDITSEILEGNNSYISGVLHREIAKRLEKKEQSVLFLNRRGYNTFISCRSCGYVATCPRCSVAMTYHAVNDRILCHCCGYSEPKGEKCPQCQGNIIKFMGIGTQKLEQELHNLFPDANIVRLDADTTMRKTAFEKILNGLRDKTVDILIGTQMVTKGLDFPDVTLVGVISADQMLYSDSFFAYEQAFAMLTQVIGRAGRSGKKGLAIIQTTNVENEVLKLAMTQDYIAFYKGEIEQRRERLYPPFCDICMLVFTGIFEKDVENAANIFYNSFVKKIKENNEKYSVNIYSPTQAGIYKINNKYRFKIFMKCRNDKVFRKAISDCMCEYFDNKQVKNVGIAVELNPYSSI